MTDLTIQQASRHAVYVQRFAGHLANGFDPYLENLKRELKIIMIDAPEQTQNIKAINKLIADYKKASTIVYGDYSKDVLIAGLKEFSGDEASWQAVMLDDAVNSKSIALATASPAQAWAAVVAEPLVFPDNNGVKMLQPFIKGWEQNQIEKVSDIIRTGFITGRTNAQITQDIAGKNGYLDNQNRKSIKSMVRTATTHTSNLARQATFDANDDVILGYEWVSTLDGRTSSTCKGLDGKIFKNKDKNKRYPPAHPNCVLEGTIVSTCSDISNYFKRAYKGKIVDITTKSGRTLSVTPNHPILTSGGWKDAKFINRSDQLATVPDFVIISEEYKNSVIAEVGELFCALNISVEPSFIANRPTTAEDFHGDVTEAEVCIINIDGLSWDRVKSIFNKKIVNNRLHGGLRIHRAFKSFRSFYLRLNRDFATPNGFIGFVSQSLLFVKRSAIHSCLLLLRAVSNYAVFAFNKCSNWPRRTIKVKECRNTANSNARVISMKNIFNLLFSKLSCISKRDVDSSTNEDPFNGLFTDAESLADRLKTDHVDGVEFDDVVNVTFREVDSHVYNLENKDNWYLSNGIITHNCRSSTAPVLDARYKLDDSVNTRASRGAEGGQQVNADLTYYGWLKDQGAQGPKGRAFVLDTLGNERGKLFLDGGLTADKFKLLTLDELFQPIPLKDLRKKQSLQLAFDQISG